MKFTKMHGIGNDYVYVDCTKKELKDPAEISKIVSDRHFGIGSDGLILIGSSDRADFRMNIYNADGSQAEMCGNGIRCVAKYVYDYGLTDKDEISVDTLAGIKYLKLTIENGKVSKVRVNMGKPILKASEIPVKAEKEPVVAEAIEAGGREWKMTCVSMGNPHAVIFIDTPVKEFPLETFGPLFESHERFPKRTNTEFVRVLDRKTMEMRVWERYREHCRRKRQKYSPRLRKRYPHLLRHHKRKYGKEHVGRCKQQQVCYAHPPEIQRHKSVSTVLSHSGSLNSSHRICNG